MNKSRLLIFSFLFFPIRSWASDPQVSSQWNWAVSSDYGPRLTTDWDFHKGIDFNASPKEGVISPAASLNFSPLTIDND
jgi:murein DD-endopeptidase MepM/ murein hydrolase activator NlpD